ncbi:hypothetical protein [Mycoplasma sp. VS1572C]
MCDYKFNKNDLIIKHPYWIALRCAIAFFYTGRIIGYEPTSKVDVKEISDLEKWEKIDTSQLENYCSYKDSINCKKIYWISVFAPFLMGLANGILVTFFVVLCAKPSIYKFPTWTKVVSGIIFCTLPILTTNLLWSLRSMFAEICINRSFDMDHLEKLKYFVKTRSKYNSMAQYLNTIESEPFLEYIGKSFIRYS